ncbi:response regulator transcription factor [Lapillicoccus jejuensis]|uniref:Winged helix family two component transcriptional regulator n=1 Tax=Lapillicoccus jejuensis TaxID=402171 RepID=A0A542E0C0_9MICO|nr:response regulator transcription factor [Lapillicoccus jejuensis]TQJ08785.1 winged helix family two component transcriptional regulator [Lapillicoccus jejuensis]
MRGAASLLVVDDDARVRTVVCWQLEAEGYDVHEAADGYAAWAGIERHRPDLVVLDLSLPGLSGLDLLRRLRAAGDVTPVVVLSGRDGEGDRITGLDLGADDYLVKPFSPGELAARVRSVLRRTVGRDPSGRGATDGQAPRPPATGGGAARLRIDHGTREVEVDGEPVPLTAKEFDLVAFLHAHPRQVFTRAQLLEHVWASSHGWQSEATVTEHVHRLRHKLGPGHLVTVRGVGYRSGP